MARGRNIDEKDLLAAGTELIEREAALIDERRWDEWLALFTPDCEYWMPAWKPDDTLTIRPWPRTVAFLLCEPRRARGPHLPHPLEPLARLDAAAAHDAHPQQRARARAAGGPSGCGCAPIG